MIPAVAPYRGAGGDPFFADVALLLHFDGANGQTTTVDSSGAPHAMTLTSAQLSTAQAEFGPSSLIVTAGTSGSCNTAGTISPPDNLQLGSNPWTLEFWIYPTSISAAYVMNFNTSNSGYVPINVILRSDGGGTGHLEVNGFNSGTTQVIIALVTNSGGLPVNAWSFIQIRRRNGVSGNDVVETAVNGVQQAATQNMTAGTSLYPTNAIDIGGTGGSSLSTPGYIDEFRLTNGVARAFNLPTAPFPNF